MDATNFCYWLQGFFEINGDKVQSLSETEIQQIKNHLALTLGTSAPKLKKKSGISYLNDRLNMAVC
jgi:hypothetical protein